VTSAKIRILALSAVLLGLTACATGPSPAPLAETLSRDPAVSTFSKLVDQAGLKEELSAAGPLTVFVPSDEAFKQVPAATLEKLSADKEQLKSVLRFHVIGARILAADVNNGNQKTAQGANLAVSRAGDFVTVGEDAVVTKKDIMATNGVAHVIDRVLMPPAPKK
jgi:uncharacterized surface protein with fasciclin (FAS1) repeats